MSRLEGFEAHSVREQPWATAPVIKEFMRAGEGCQGLSASAVGRRGSCRTATAAREVFLQCISRGWSLEAGLCLGSFPTGFSIKGARDEEGAADLKRGPRIPQPSSVMFTANRPKFERSLR